MLKTALSTPTLALALAVGAAPLPALASASVTVSIKPLHSLVSAVMQGAGEPVLLVKGAASPHTYSLRPSDAAAIQDAQVVFWSGPELEAFLEKPLEALTDGATDVALMHAPGVKLLAPREDGNFEPHEHEGHEHADHDDHEHENADHDDHEHEHEDHDAHEGEHDHAEEVDPHFWLDPENARAAVKTIAATLSAADPENASLYSKNAQNLDAELKELETELRAEAAPLAGKPYIVFHDAYQYFENYFGMSATGSVTINPQVQPGAARISEIETKLKNLGAVCIFTEPQFEPKLVQSLAANTNVRTGELDPLGASIEAGPKMYETLLKSLVSNMKACLMPS